jgi:hypothetical protein
MAAVSEGTGEQRKNNVIDSASNLLSNTNYVCHTLLYLKPVPVKHNFVSELNRT